MTYDEITKALNETGLSWVSAAKVVGKSRTTLVRVAKGDLTSAPTAKAICVLIKKTPKEVFPDHPSYAAPGAEAQRSLALEEARKNLVDAGFKACA